MNNGIYFGIGTALALHGEASPVTQYQLSDEDLSYRRSASRFRTSVSHVGKDFKAIGACIPSTERDGRLIYKMKGLPEDISLDIIEAAVIAEKGFDALERNDMAKARELAESAMDICPDSPSAQRLRHHVLLRSPDAPFRDILRAARDTSKRATEVVRQLTRLEAIVAEEDWKRHREIIAAEMDRLHSELDDLTILRIRTEQRIWPVLRKQEDDRQVGELCTMSVMANRMEERHQKYYRNAIAEHPTVHRLAAEATRKILAMANPRMPIQLDSQDVFRTAVKEVARCITQDIDGSAFSVLAELRLYIRERCGVRTFLQCIADLYGLDPDLVGLVYRKWTFERKIEEAEDPAPDTETLRKELALSRPEEEDRYWKMISTEDVLRQNRIPLTALSRSTGSASQDDGWLSPEVIAATTDDEQIEMTLARTILAEAAPGFVERLHVWMDKNGELGSRPPTVQGVAKLLSVSTGEAKAFIVDLSQLIAIAGIDKETDKSSKAA